MEQNSTNKECFIGSQIKRARFHLRLPLNVVASKIGIHRTTLSEYELDHCHPSVYALTALGDLYFNDKYYFCDEYERFVDKSDQIINGIIINHNLSLQMLADICGVTKQSVWAWTKKKSSPSRLCWTRFLCHLTINNSFEK